MRHGGQGEIDRVRLVQGQHRLGHVAHLIDDGIAGRRDTADDADREQRQQQYPFERQDTVVRYPNLPDNNFYDGLLKT